MRHDIKNQNFLLGCWCVLQFVKVLSHISYWDCSNVLCLWLCGVMKNEASFLQLSKYYTEYGLRSKLACRTHHGPNHLLLWWQISFRFFSFSRSLKWNNGTFPLTEMRGVANILIFSFEFFSGFLRSKRFGPLSYTSNDSYVYNSGAYQPVLITWTIWFQEEEKETSCSSSRRGVSKIWYEFE